MLATIFCYNLLQISKMQSCTGFLGVATLAGPLTLPLTDNDLYSVRLRVASKTLLCEERLQRYPS